MLTLFATPKPFRGHIGIIQRNALKSWTLLAPDVEVILFGDDDGAAETARDLGLRHEPQVQRNEQGGKFLPHIFARAQQIARHGILCYANCDIVLTEELARSVQEVASQHSRFLLVGRRWDLDVTAPLDFSSAGWDHTLMAQARSAGSQRPSNWIDFFAFPRGQFTDLLPLVIGRVGWDCYLLWLTRQRGIPLVDASPVITAVHQNHDYAYHPQGEHGVWHDQQAQRNIALAGGMRNMFTMDDATHLLTPAGLRRRWSYPFAPARRAAHRAWFRAWFAFLGATRPVRHALGLHQQTLDVLRRKVRAQAKD
jgi:hypothetical protein